MQFRTSRFGTVGKVGVSAAVGVALVLAAALPASAASSTITDKKNDTTKLTVTTSNISSASKKDPYVDITKLTAKRSSTTLKVTITVAKVKKGYADQVAILIRTKKTTTPHTTILILPAHKSKSVIVTGAKSASLPSSIKLTAKKGTKGTYTVTIPLSKIGKPAKLSVAASVVHVNSTSSSKSVQTSDTTGSTKSLKSIKWTAFLKK